MAHNFFKSSVGMKVMMAVTGVCLLLFVVFHLLGNLQIFMGPAKFNDYAEFLEELGPLLWVARGGLLVVFLVHIATAITLKRRNSSARPVEYVAQSTVTASSPSLWMVETGIVILCFVIIHLLHFTFGVLHPELAELKTASGEEDVYRMVVSGFQDPVFSIGYIVAMLVLGFHLSHGIRSVFQTLGFYHGSYTASIKRVGLVIAWLLAGGYISIPASVLLGLVR